MINDFLYITQWWYVLLLLGLFFLPLTSLIFKSFFDKGYIFSKTLGLLLISYLVWILASFKVLTFDTVGIFAAASIFALINFHIARKTKYMAFAKHNLKIFFIEEFIFLIGLIFWSYIRSHEPSIHGLEKFMDYGFINSILRSEYFPPKDLWMSPLSINYYYFGHLIAATLIKISRSPSEIGYNLILSTIFGLTFVSSFSIGANLYKKYCEKAKLITLVATGLLSGFLVTLSGNLHTIYSFFEKYANETPVPFWTLPLKLAFEDYWYPNATRFIPKTIHEFPLYGFVVADLHGHIFNIIAVLLFFALIIEIFFRKKISPFYTILFGFLIGIFLMTNILDGPIYLLTIAIVIFLGSIRQTNLQQALKNTLFTLTPIFFLAIFFSLPFWLNFKPFSSGIGLLCPPSFLYGKSLAVFIFEENHCSRSPIWMLGLLYGFFYFVLAGYITLNIRQKLRSFHPADYLALSFFIIGTILIITPEIFYVKDIYPEHYRANTVFKFGFQAFMILAIASGYMIIRVINFYRVLVLAPFLFLIFIYPIFAIRSYYGGLKNYQGLDGLSYLKQIHPGDYDAIVWFNHNVKGQPVVLEAQGDSYTDYARISANTGLPTVLGWPVHEWLWRGSYDEPGKRVAEVVTLYEGDLETTKQLIKKYGISYVVVGRLEKSKYKNLDETKFQSLGQEIFKNEGTTIYKVTF